MHRSRGLEGTVRALFALPLALAVAAPVTSAFAQVPDRDIDLVREKGLHLESQLNYTWSEFPVGHNTDASITIGKCGCFLTNLMTLSNHYYGTTSLPHFPWNQIYLEQTILSFSPRYLDLYLRFEYQDPAGGSGYKRLGNNTCETAPKPWALRNIGKPIIGAIAPATGLTFRGARRDYASLNRIGANLMKGNPTLVTVQRRRDDGTEYRHSQIVAGWQPPTTDPGGQQRPGRYKILDPAWTSLGSQGSFHAPARVPGNGDDDAYREWWESIEEVVDVRPVLKTDPQPRRLALLDDPSPVELLVIAPDGRRTGFDPGAGRTVQEDPATDYYSIGGWGDPFGVVPPGSPAKFLLVNEPAEGTFRFVVTGVGPGRAKLEFSSVVGDSETPLLDVDDPIAPGDSLKYEARYSLAGTTVQQVASFTPEARPRAATQQTQIGSPVAFDGAGSWDAAGAIVSHAWDFGDGTTASGAATNHAYGAAGVYTVTLTVTNLSGGTGTGQVLISVIDPSAPPPGTTTEMVSVTSGGLVSPSPAAEPSLSADERYVAFMSAGALVSNDTNNVFDIYVRDLWNRTVQRVSVSSAGDQAIAASYAPAISRDGRFVAFTSDAANLVPGDTNGVRDVFVHDRQTGATEIVSVSSAGQQANAGPTTVFYSTYTPAISADGRFIAFESRATNLIAAGTSATSNIFVRDRQAGTTELVSISTSGDQGQPVCNAFGCTQAASIWPAISADGRYVAFQSTAPNFTTNDTNGQPDIFVRDRQAGTTARVSLSTTGGQITRGEIPSMSDDGRYVAFQSDAFFPGIQMEVLVRDRQAGTTERVNVATTGAIAGANSLNAGISPDGRYVAFHSLADNLVPNDTNGGLDLFLRDRTARTTERANVTGAGDQSAGLGGGIYLGRPALGRNGSVAFTSFLPVLVPFDSNGALDVYARLKPPPLLPTAVISGPYAGWAGGGATPSWITFDGRGSYGPTGAPLTARWDFGDGSPEVELSADTLPQHGYAAAGEYVATLIVNNGIGDSAPATTTVTVLEPAAPSPVVALLSECASPGETLSVFMRGSPLTDAAGGWNFGAGVPTSTNQAQPLSVLPVSFAGPLGETSVNGSIENVSVDGGVQFTTTVRAIVPALSAGEYLVGLPGATPAPLTTPCPPSVNLAPVADAGGPYRGEAGSPIMLDGSASADPQGAALAYMWDFGDGTTGTGVSPDHVYQAEGRYFVTLVVDNGSTTSMPEVRDRSFAQVTVTAPTSSNRPPSASAGASYGGVEGEAIPLSGAAASDPDGDALTYHWSADSPLCAFSSTDALSSALTCTDNGVVTVTLTVSDGTAAPVSSSASVTVANVSPVIGAIDLPIGPRPAGLIAVSAPFTDGGANDTHTCTITWDNVTAAVAGTVTATPGGGGGNCSGSRHLSAGVYVVTVGVTDDDGGAAARTASTLLVVYDPTASFVTGGGWFNSSPGADRLNPAAAGKANFGFVARYKKGASVPDGQTEFQFQAGDLNFRSTAYQWLVVTYGCLAQYKGTGTINGAPGYDFLLTLRDGDLCGSVGPDGIRMKITSAGGLRYDNTGGFDAIGPTSGNVQPIDAGSIVIHRK